MKNLWQKPKISIFEPLLYKDDPRLKNLIRAWNGKKADVGILGVPFDYGVRLSRGRAGAAKAPDAIRSQIKKHGTSYNVEKGSDLGKLHIADLGNVRIAGNNVLSTHENVTRAVSGILPLIDTLVVLGGGNDISYATIKAFSAFHKKKIGGINVDAHFDVRQVRGGRITSGTPYRRLLEGGWVHGKNFYEVAAQGHLNARAHQVWLEKQGAHIFFLSDVRRLGAAKTSQKIVPQLKKCEALFVSIDIDSVAQAFAPGSSAPSSDGLFPQDILDFVYAAGQDPRVRLFEIMEVNPKYDVDYRTLRLAVNIILSFLTGYAKRKY